MTEKAHVKNYGQLQDGDLDEGSIVFVNLEIKEKNNRTTKKYDVTAIIDSIGPYTPKEDDETPEDERMGTFYNLTVMSHGSMVGMELTNVRIQDLAEITE